MKFCIYDWAGNIKFDAREFNSFEEAWGHIYEYLHENVPVAEFDEYASEYYVYEVKS